MSLTLALPKDVLLGFLRPRQQTFRFCYPKPSCERSLTLNNRCSGAVCSTGRKHELRLLYVNIYIRLYNRVYATQTHALKLL